MSDLTPEQLKRVAEYMGYKATASCNCAKVCINPQKDKVFWKYINYNPLTNAEQSMELLKMLYKATHHLNISVFSNDSSHIYSSVLGIDVKEQSLEQAILLAAMSVAVAEGNSDDTMGSV